MTVDADPITEALASLYRLTDDLPVNVQAEGRRYVDRVEAELSRLREQRDALYEANWPWEWVIATREKERRQAAEARCARLQQALAKIRDSGPRPRTIRSDLAYVILLQGIAREALAGLDTPADSQEFTPSRAPVDPPIVLPADSQEDKT